MSNINTVGVVGAGLMGSGIAQVVAQSGYSVVVREVEQRFLDTYTLSGPSLSQAAGGTMRFGGATNGVVFSTGTVEYNGGDGLTQTITAGTYATLVLSRKTGTNPAAKQIAGDATVTATGNMTVPTTTSLTLLAGSGSTALNVNGDFNVDGDVTNNGTITVGI